jgi:methylmalonyl-CoA/ethylmalonyl-CoA epimerase
MMDVAGGQEGLRLHHAGVVVADVARSSDEYARRYGYHIESGVIHDPVQTAYVQFVRLPGDATYLEFVAPDGPNSKLANALGKGGGLNHLCYTTTDIDTTCQRLRRQGMVLVQRPTPAVAFLGRRIAWMQGRDRLLVELVEAGEDRFTPPLGTDHPGDPRTQN